MAETLTADYLVIGCGTQALSFVDEIVSSSDKTVIIVDEYPRPGGHWIFSYPFVRLHQPCAYYGVNSTTLGSNTVDDDGWNKGLSRLSRGAEVCAYFEQVMQEKLLRSGRAQYFPEHTYKGGHEFVSIRTGKAYQVSKDCCLVDGTYSRTQIPSKRPPPFEVEEGLKVIPPNGLPDTFTSQSFTEFTVIGAGKTGIDSCLWLLQNDVPADRITWIMNRASYFFDREAYQPGPENAAKKQARAEGMQKAIMDAGSAEELLRLFVEGGHLLQLDEAVQPTMFHCATVSQIEFAALKTIKNVVRKGRVTSITREKVILQHGTFTPSPNSLYIDCSATAIPKTTPVPVFEDGKITLQPVRLCQQAFSAALIAHVETTYDDQAVKNQLTLPIPMPDRPNDFPLASLRNNMNSVQWYQHPKTFAWVRESRLNMYREVMPPPPEDPKQYDALVEKLVAGTNAVSEKLMELLMQSPLKEEAKEAFARGSGSSVTGRAQLGPWLGLATGQQVT